MGFNFTADSLIHANFTSFVMVVAIITYACMTFKVGDVFEKQRQKIKSVVDTSEANKQASIEDLNNIKSELDVLPKKIEKLEDEAKNTAKVLSEGIAKDAENKKEILQNNANTSIEYQIKSAKQKLSQDVSFAAVNLAKDNFVEMVKNNTDLQYKIVNECIEKL